MKYAGSHPSEDDLQAAIAAVRERSLLSSSERRLETILDLCEDVPAVFAEVFLSEWPLCDDTWRLRRRLLWALRRTELNLPGRRTVYRGCSSERVRGVSWTTLPDIALGFALGHRTIGVPQPVIAKAEIKRGFATFDDRSEREVVLDPKRLRGLIIAAL